MTTKVLLINKTNGEAVRYGEPSYLPPGHDPRGYCQLAAPVEPWYRCTLRLGHAGDCAAHGEPGVMFARWRNDDGE